MEKFNELNNIGEVPIDVMSHNVGRLVWLNDKELQWVLKHREWIEKTNLTDAHLHIFNGDTWDRMRQEDVDKLLGGDGGRT